MSGYVPVVNRGQKDIDSNKAIKNALEHERQFFENHPSYSSKAQYCGTPFLARKLNLVCCGGRRRHLPAMAVSVAHRSCRWNGWT